MQEDKEQRMIVSSDSFQRNLAKLNRTPQQGAIIPQWAQMAAYNCAETFRTQDMLEVVPSMNSMIYVH